MECVSGVRTAYGSGISAMAPAASRRPPRRGIAPRRPSLERNVPSRGIAGVDHSDGMIM
jgi:hypothetical protein